MKNAVLNRFTLQVALSTVAVVLVHGNLPFLLQHAALPTVLLGTLFFLSRVGGIAGAQAGPSLLRAMPPEWACAGAEAVNAAATALLYWAAVTSRPLPLCAAILIKGVTIGLIPNLRVTWLKALPTPDIGRRVMIVTRVIVQSSYGLVGVLLLLGLAQKWVMELVLLDLVTSLLAIPIFLSLKDLGVASIEPPPDEGTAFRFLFEKSNRHLLSAEVCLAVAMGGTNIFLVRAGEGLFKAVGGYGLALVAYAAAYLFAGAVVQSPDDRGRRIRARIEPAAPWLLVLCLALMTVPSAGIAVTVTVFAALFVAYPTFLLTLESLWFEVSSKSNISRTFASRLLLLSIVSALGEVAYPTLSLRAELVMRTVAALGAALLFVRFSSLRQSLLPSKTAPH